MLGSRRYRSGATWVAPLMLLALVAPSPARSQDPVHATGAELAGDVVQIVSRRSNLEIAERFSKVVQFKDRILRVDGHDPTVLSVTALNANQLRLQALEQGVTTVVITDELQQSHVIEVFVTGDARLLQSVLKKAYPTTAVTATKVRDAVMLRGWVTEPQQISEIVALAQLYFPTVLNQMKVGGPQEVQLRVKVLEVQRSLIRRFGINFTAIGRNAAFTSTPGPISPLSTFSLPFGGPPGVELASNQLSNASMALGIATDDFVFQGLIQAMKQEGLLKINSEPVLVTRSGEAAKLINGGEFPIPVPQALGVVTIEWREFGVTLESLPIVLSPTTLKQQITAEVSERDFTSAVTLSGTTVPGLTKRTIQTQAVMEFGQTLVIGGLISTRYTSQSDKIPFLGELPGIGAAFRRMRYDTAETELLVLVTPEYASALPSDQIPPGGPGLGTTVPTDRELYKNGSLEIPNYGEPCEGCQNQQGQPGYGPVPTAQPGMVPIAPGPAAAPALPPAPALPEAGAEPALIGPPGAPAIPQTSARLQRTPQKRTAAEPIRDSAVQPAGYAASAEQPKTAPKKTTAKR